MDFVSRVSGHPFVIFVVPKPALTTKNTKQEAKLTNSAGATSNIRDPKHLPAGLNAPQAERRQFMFLDT